jgi:glycosyl transferase family 2/tetratricopeptide repeat protein
VSARDAQVALQEGNALNAGGQVQAAIAAYRRALGHHPEFGAAHYNLGVALRRARDWRGAALAFRHAARLDASDFDAVQGVAAALADAVQAGEEPFPAPAAKALSGPREGVSIVVCSIDDTKLARMRSSFTAALAGRDHEFIVIRDARSLAEAYTRGLALCRHEWVVFSHDDVELASERPFDVLAAALAECDVVGVAGSRLVSGPAVTWAGHPHVHGWVAYPAKDAQPAWDASFFSLEGGLLHGMQALDGLLFATRREVVRRVGFDARTFDGFHFYDLDFTYRAHLQGMRLAVTTDAIAIHASGGQFGAEWKRYAERFEAKFPALRTPVGDYHAYGVRLRSTGHVLGFYRALRGLGSTA